MPENTVTTSLAPMHPDGVRNTFDSIRALQADDIDTACAVIEDTGCTEVRLLLLDIAARIFIPITATGSGRDRAGDGITPDADRRPPRTPGHPVVRTGTAPWSAT
ncbi:hypothetical protein [Streptomyces sp. NBC_00690]|uniref:hypothetical protein n=1 Tax=Streptomyces sp. NBC_00690 TaxID=2975808 RepID=UPI002E2C6E99|nr:hypothetical protein [Streptomyces sp. NBC_00690]